MSSQNPIVSIIIPCYNEEEVLLACHSRLMQVFEGYDESQFELIYVNDGSSDRTEELLRYLHDAYSHTRVVMLSRNFGHQAAVTAGLTAATGQCVVIIDADLQDPLDVIHEMVAQYRNGYDVVCGQRTVRKGENIFKRATAWFFYRMMQIFFLKSLPHDVGDFRLMSRRCVDSLRSMRELHRFLGVGLRTRESSGTQQQDCGAIHVQIHYCKARDADYSWRSATIGFTAEARRAGR